MNTMPAAQVQPGTVPHHQGGRRRSTERNEQRNTNQNGDTSNCEKNDVCNKPCIPNPAPLGLIAFGFTTALLQVKHARLGGSTTEELNAIDVHVMGFALFFGGLLQILVGQNEIRRNSLFGYTAFSVYGGFWMSIGIIKLVTLLATDTPVYINPKAAEGVLFMLAIVSILFWTLTFSMNKTICSLFGLLCITVILLAFGVQNEAVDKIGGYFGVATSINAIWLAYAELVNAILGKGKEIIPLGKFEWKNMKCIVIINSKPPNHDRGDVEQGANPTN